MASAAPLNYFLHAYGPAATPTMTLGWVFTGIVSGVCIVVGVLLLAAILRRHPHASYVTLVKEKGDLRWISLGTGVSVIILLGMTIYALIVLNQSAAPPAKPALTITVTGYDWWWKVEYADPSMPIMTANEIHIPTGVPVLMKLNSADVIHAFWVPELAGKTQMIPGLTNQQWLEADKPGVYRGQCTQFCGLQHAHMGFEVVAESPEEFQAWETAQTKPAAADASTKAGAHIFMSQCAACHAVRGTGAAGTHGPDLTHLMSRRMIGAATLPTTPENAMNWVAHVQELKPGAQMPDFILSPLDAAALSAYLTTLK